MNEIIYPRSPRETMAGWLHLPRYVDKLRLHLAGKLHPDYQPNLGQGLDGMWCQAAGVTHEQMLELVRHSVTDGEVCAWVCQHAPKSAAEKAAHASNMLGRPAPDNATAQERLAQRKAAIGIAHRDDIKTFVDLIDADEKRL
jgi:gluconokinase